MVRKTARQTQQRKMGWTGGYHRQVNKTNTCTHTGNRRIAECPPTSELKFLLTTREIYLDKMYIKL